MGIIFWIPFLRPWWWFFAPIFLSIQLRTLYLWWLAWDFTYPKEKWVMLEIIPPREVLTPIKAMEDIFTVMFNTLADTANFREIWCEGELDNTPYWMSYELISIEGAIHILARVSSKHVKMLENALYSHYPELEMHEVSDYSEVIPKNIPNDEWDMWTTPEGIEAPDNFDNFYSWAIDKNFKPKETVECSKCGTDYIWNIPQEVYNSYF